MTRLLHPTASRCGSRAALGRPNRHLLYRAVNYIQMLQEANVEISMAEVGEAWQNGYAERLIRTIKEEEIGLSDYQDNTDAIYQLSRFLD